ncbi:MAG: His/Gly/Thr/Pro-type tRNA ligase C-terminal domain-containing protein, partial [Thermoplasmata archaeon]
IYPAGQNFYWTVNVEYMIEDAERRAREIATVQIDVGNAKRFGITFANEEGKRRYPLILHTAILGSVERYLYTILDTAVAEEKAGRKGTLPLWLNPEQVRLLPVAEDHREMAAEMADALVGVRVGIDDRSATVAKKVREAKQDWVGYVVVVGEREAKEKAPRLTVYDRQADEDREMTLEELRGEIGERTSGRPFRPLYFPRELSRRPEF